MSQLLHLAKPADLEKLLPMVAALHTLLELPTDDAHREAALKPLLDGSPHGAIWMIGPTMAPVGYIAVSFGWSIEFGGMDGFIDEFYIRDSVRGRGMGTEVLAALIPELAAAGMKAIHLEVNKENFAASKLYERMGFRLRDKYNLMSWVAPSG